MALFSQGYEKRRYYIATQGPMPATIVDFWKMIWQEKSGKIVMLTNLVENSKIKCSQYWPSEPDTKQMWGNMQVILKDISKRNDYIIRTFELLNRKTNKERTIIQFHFTIWPDHGVPSSPASLVSFRKLIKRTPSALPGPIVVHCSAGVGRTGTFLGFDTLMEDSAENDVIDVFKYVSVMRADRPSMVQSRAQYSFLHQVIYEGIRARNSLLTLDEIKQLKYRPMLVEEETVETEFKSVMLLKKEHHKINTRSAREAENIPKNRTGHIVPHDNYRAYLVTHVEGRNDYIQASLVPSLFSRDGFITTQLPMESTIIDFWRMVYEYNSLTIISLVDQESDHKIDPPFWPITGGNFKSGPFLITMTETSEPDSFYTETVVALEKTDAPDPSIRSTINIYKVHEWPVGVDVPDKRGLLALIRAIQKREEDVGYHSIVVQDIDGSTKCNLFCTIVNCINRLKEDKVLDVMLTVRDMHVVQPQCISTLPEYRFCYEMAKEYVDTLSE
ncbi:hypothetical protein SNE40_015176 [Patella caerulea]|uniref:protein-tyrosine-phosphatase n=1 Tax=Patella caerulea TaxID=87958 RepID=A0AAN8JH96_PATCE